MAARPSGTSAARVLALRIPPVTDELTRSLFAAQLAFTAHRMRLIRDLPGNPYGMELMSFDGAFAVATPGRAHLHWMNMVGELYPEHASLVPDMVAFYRRVGTSPTFSVPTTSNIEPLGKALVSAGARPVRTLALLYGRAVAPLPGPSDAVVRQIAPGEIDRFVSIFAEGYELPEEERARVPADISAWPSIPGITLYLAEVDRAAAAVGVLFTRDEIGYLANASTRPELRRRGAHAALLERRIADAAGSGCRLVSGLAAFGSGSQRNMERVGLRLAGVVTQWSVA